jgi:hypothetical protein
VLTAMRGTGAGNNIFQEKTFFGTPEPYLFEFS